MSQEDMKKMKDDSINHVPMEQADKEQKIKEALTEKNFLNDTFGHWTTDSVVSSTYGSEKATDKTFPYSKYQLLGKPDVGNYSDDSRAWVSKEADKGIE